MLLAIWLVETPAIRLFMTTPSTFSVGGHSTSDRPLRFSARSASRSSRDCRLVTSLCRNSRWWKCCHVGQQGRTALNWFEVPSDGKIEIWKIQHQWLLESEVIDRFSIHGTNWWATWEWWEGRLTCIACEGIRRRQSASTIPTPFRWADTRCLSGQIKGRLHRSCCVFLSVGFPLKKGFTEFGKAIKGYHFLFWLNSSQLEVTEFKMPKWWFVTGSRGAFAALREDGELITWGHAAFGGSWAVPVFFWLGHPSSKMATLLVGVFVSKYFHFHPFHP